MKKVQLEIKDDELPEPDEQVLVYLTDPKGGARVASDSDSGLQVRFTHLFSFEDFLRCKSLRPIQKKSQNEAFLRQSDSSDC